MPLASIIVDSGAISTQKNLAHSVHGLQGHLYSYMIHCWIFHRDRPSSPYDPAISRPPILFNWIGHLSRFT